MLQVVFNGELSERWGREAQLKLCSKERCYAIAGMHMKKVGIIDMKTAKEEVDCDIVCLLVGCLLLPKK